MPMVLIVIYFLFDLFVRLLTLTLTCKQLGTAVTPSIFDLFFT